MASLVYGVATSDAAAIGAAVATFGVVALGAILVAMRGGGSLRSHGDAARGVDPSVGHGAFPPTWTASSRINGRPNSLFSVHHDAERG
jgi:hypothetical protein